MNVETGKFTAPFKGVYSFTFSGTATSTFNYVAFPIMKNGQVFSWVVVGLDLAPGIEIQKYQAYLTSSWMMQLNEKDTISIDNFFGTLKPYRYHPLNFSGQLIMKEK